MNHVTIAPRFHVALDRGCAEDGRKLRRMLFTFGAYGGHRVFVIGHHLDEALEVAADVLESVAPGLFLPFSEAEADENGKVVDHTYTECGYLPSWEWTVDDVERSDIKALLAEAAARL